MTVSAPKCPGCQALQQQVDQLRAEVAELKGLLQQNSANSSRPPSTDPPSAPRRPPHVPSGRKRGGQQGHRGVTRTRLPVAAEACVPCLPTTCRHCQAALPGPATNELPPRCHQVLEVPRLALEVTEYQLHGRTCHHCGKRTWGELPPEAPTRGEGFRLQALTALLTGRHHVSRRQTGEFVGHILGQRLSPGTLAALEADMARALEAAYQEIAQAVARAPWVNVDETGWREARLRPYLWTVVTQTATLFHIGNRTKATFAELLPERYSQVVGSDRYAAYDHLDPRRRALCWAHLLRDLQALTERSHPRAQLVGAWGQEIAAALFACWYRYRDGELDRAALQAAAAPLQTKFQTLLALGIAGACPKTAGFCRALLDRWEALWTFLSVEGVEPTNNSAERALRPAVLWRKRSSGHQSPSGKEFVERMLSVTTTLRQQGRNVLEFLEATLRAVAANLPPPSVLPPTASVRTA